MFFRKYIKKSVFMSVVLFASIPLAKANFVEEVNYNGYQEFEKIPDHKSSLYEVGLNKVMYLENYKKVGGPSEKYGDEVMFSVDKRFLEKPLPTSYDAETEAFGEMFNKHIASDDFVWVGLNGDYYKITSTDFKKEGHEPFSPDFHTAAMESKRYHLSYYNTIGIDFVDSHIYIRPSGEVKNTGWINAVTYDQIGFYGKNFFFKILDDDTIAVDSSGSGDSEQIKILKKSSVVPISTINKAVRPSNGDYEDYLRWEREATDVLIEYRRRNKMFIYNKKVR